MFMRLDNSGLLEHQVDSFSDLVKIQEKDRASLDASDMGVGKTYAGAALMRHFDEPTVVVCPPSVIPAWELAGERMGVEFDIVGYEKIRRGGTHYITKKPVEFTSSEGRKVKYNRFEWAPEVKFVLFDEAHRCNGQTSDQSKLLIRAKAQGKRIHLMTATPAESPLKMKAMGYALDLFDSPSAWWKWCLRHGCKKGYFGGYAFGKNSEQRIQVMQRLNSILFPSRGVRLRISDLPGFPEVVRSVDLMGLPRNDVTKMTALYEEMSGELRAIDAKGLGENEAIRLMRQRQTVEMLKVPSLVEMVEDGVSQGMSVALFVNFKDTVKALSARLKTDCIIWGNNTAEKNEASRKRFQNNESRIILVIIDAGCVGIDLHDITGKHPVLGLYNPGWNVTLFIQALGRTHRSGAKSKAIQRILFADKTPEMKVFKKLGGKVNDLESLRDAYARAIGDLFDLKTQHKE